MEAKKKLEAKKKRAMTETQVQCEECGFVVVHVMRAGTGRVEVDRKHWREHCQAPGDGNDPFECPFLKEAIEQAPSS